EKATEMVSELRGMRIDMQNTMIQLIESVSENPKLLSPSDDVSSSSTNFTLHNLPQPDYVKFVGRESQLLLIRELLKPDNRVWTVVIDGIGGIGKTALALEIAHQYLNRKFAFPEQERFEAIVWTSAKNKMLTADGISPRYQSTQTLQDIYRAISITLEADDIVTKDLKTQHLLIRRLLARRRTLLIIDNLETLEDESVLSFLRDLPAPSKCLVTSRQRIDIAYAIRLVGMTEDDAEIYIRDQATQRNVKLSDNQINLLYRRTGGIPLAISWSIAQIHFGYEVDSVLFKLGNATGDIAQYCFSSSLNAIRRTEAFTILLVISLVPSYSYLNRSKIGQITGLSDSDRDEGLVILERLSLINREKDRFSVLDLVREFTVSEFVSLDGDTGQKLILRLAQVDDIAGAYALEIAKPFMTSETHHELAKQITEILIDEMYKMIQYPDDYYMSMYVNPFEKLATPSAIATLRGIVGGLFQLGWGSSNIEWAEQEALRALCRLGDIDFVILFYAEGLPYTGYLKHEDVVSSLLQYTNIDTVIKTIDSKLQEENSEQVKQGLMDLKQKLATTK
ncbi:MAG: ATP-binding protein, partial [Anaerolineae bacterium]|nr:ATP-binding protein [Anaerolineae bacterium]